MHPQVDDSGNYDQLSGLSDQDFKSVYLKVNGSYFCPTFTLLAHTLHVVEASYFQLYRRAKHVLSEACDFVISALLIMGTCPMQFYGELGMLVNESQTSCCIDYGCSCPELDELTQTCCDTGAFGSC
jgi:galactokinase